MADKEMGNIHGVAAVGGNNRQDTAYADADQLSVAAMRARLTAINATTYSAAQLNKMTRNDMAYAIRVADDPGTIK